MTKINYSNQNRSNKTPRKGISKNEIKSYKEDAKKLAERLKKGRKTNNKVSRNSGPVKVYTKEEIAAMGIT